MSWLDVLGYAASLAVLSTFCMRNMIPLRILALGSNVLFGLYGYFDHLYPVLILHSILFPVNLFRLVQFWHLIRVVENAPREGLSVRNFLPLMTKRSFAAGETLVRKGEKANSLYYLADGELEIPELQKVLKAGVMVGEIGVFAPHQERSATVICRTDCTVFEMTETKAKQLFFQDRSFGFAVLQLAITRLLENYQDVPVTKAP